MSTPLTPSSPIRAVTVYCASSAEIHPSYQTAARALGQAIALQGWTLVYGGNRTGSMLEVAEGARSAQGRVVGITPQLFVDKGSHDTTCDELVITQDMTQRKQLLAQRADAFVALPGGLGTYEELFEQLVARQLRYHDKPIIALNLHNYFAPLQSMIEHGISEKFIKPKARTLLQLANTVEEVISLLKNPAHLPSTPIESLSHEAAQGH